MEHLTTRTRRIAITAVPRPAPGRYLAVEDDLDVLLVPLVARVTRIGRSIGADISIDSGSVSRRHARVVLDGDRATLLDDRSLNGTYRNGERVDSALLRDGDVIRVGRTRLQYVEVAAAGEEAPGAHRAAA